MKTESTLVNEPFIDQLLKLCSDRGHRAELRRYWSLGTRHYAYPVIGRLGVMSEPKLADAITAALYSVNPNHQLGGASPGKALLQLAGGNDKANGFDSFERHFRRLLACEDGDLQEVGDQLHRLFKRLERETISLDYNRLLWDLRSWRNKSDDIKTRWARDFWQAPSEQEMSAPNPAAP